LLWNLSGKESSCREWEGIKVDREQYMHRTLEGTAGDRNRRRKVNKREKEITNVCFVFYMINVGLFTSQLCKL
jgi:hypothetical protein